MPSVQQVLEALEQIAPKRYAFSFDKVGLQVGDRSASVSKGVVALDRSVKAVDFAAAEGAQLLLCHHPLLFEPLHTIDYSQHVGRTITRLVQLGIANVAAHTNWDSAKGGVNDELAKRLEMSQVRDFGTSNPVKQLKLVVTCPPESAEPVLDSITGAGAGVIGNYSRCAFTSEGIGTFKGGAGSNPTVGRAGKIEHVPETRIEVILREDQSDRVLRALRRAHPYEEPAFDFYPVTTTASQPAGRIGVLSAPMPLREFADRVDACLHTRCLTWGEPSSRIETVAVVGGAADGEWRAALHEGADVFLTGEVRQHNALEGVETGMAMISAGHFATEQPGCEALRDRMALILPEVEWTLFTPEPGLAGRPFCARSDS